MRKFNVNEEEKNIEAELILFAENSALNWKTFPVRRHEIIEVDIAREILFVVTL